MSAAAAEGNQSVSELRLVWEYNITGIAYIGF